MDAVGGKVHDMAAIYDGALARVGWDGDMGVCSDIACALIHVA